MRIVCFGDSLTACGGDGGTYCDILRDRFPGHTFFNRGLNGDTLRDAAGRLTEDVLDDRPDIVLVELGANDWHRAERPPRAWAADLEKLVGRIRAAGAVPVICGVFGDALDDAGRAQAKVEGTDERGRSFAALEADLAARLDCPHVPNIQALILGRRCCWGADGHPNEYGNRRVADVIEPVLTKLLKARALPVRRAPATTRDMWLEAVRLAPERLAVADGDRRLTYAQVDASASRVAAALAALSGVPRPRVAAFLPNGLEYVLLYWAVARLGGTIVPFNTWLKRAELERLLESVRPDVLVVRGPRDEALYACERVRPRVLVALEEGTEGARDWGELLEFEGPAVELPPIGPDDVAIIMHTSGTTGVPKGAVMRHSDLMFNVTAAINAHGFCRSDVNLLTSPMFHCGPFYTSLPTAAYTKASVVLASPTRPEELIDAVIRERVTTIMTAPSVFEQLLRLKGGDSSACPSLRLFAYAGSPMPSATIGRLRERFPGVALQNFFGLTETISMTHVLRDADTDAQPDSIGRLLPFVDALVVDDALRPVPAGVVGELLFARENVIVGYYNQPERLREALVTLEGREWFRTGDCASVDAEGFFRIKGRKKEMIIVGGENVYAAEVETFLAAHPGVVEAAVKGVPATGVRAFLGEQVVAFVVRADDAVTERDLRGYCFDGLPSYKVPRRIVFLDALPRNPSGKVVKGELPEVD